MVRRSRAIRDARFHSISTDSRTDDQIGRSGNQAGSGLSGSGFGAVILPQNAVIGYSYVVEGSCLYLTEGSRHHLESGDVPDLYLDAVRWGNEGFERREAA